MMETSAWNTPLGVAILVQGIALVAVLIKVFLSDRDLKRDMVSLLRRHHTRIEDLEDLTGEHNDYLVRQGFTRIGVPRRRRDDASLPDNHNKIFS